MRVARPNGARRGPRASRREPASSANIRRLAQELRSRRRVTQNAIKRAMDPLRSFSLQLEEEVEGYERLKRGELGELDNLHGLGRTLVTCALRWDSRNASLPSGLRDQTPEPRAVNGKVVAPVDVFVRMGMLAPADLEAWRRGKVPYLERVVHGSLSRLSRLLRVLGFHCHDLNLVATPARYTVLGRKPVPLRFTKTGEALFGLVGARGHQLSHGGHPSIGADRRTEDIEEL